MVMRYKYFLSIPSIVLNEECFFNRQNQAMNHTNSHHWQNNLSVASEAPLDNLIHNNWSFPQPCVPLAGFEFFVSLTVS
jgi:hypothetical protein